MRPIPQWHQATFEIVVTPNMTVDFEELGEVHHVYATYWMVKHMELTGRKVLLPFLDEGEEAIGYEVKVRHLASALPGMRVRIVAEHLRTEKNRMYARCWVYNELEDLIGEGETTQVILSKDKIQQNFALLSARAALLHKLN